jgi:hypothetical protein
MVAAGTKEANKSQSSTSSSESIKSNNADALLPLCSETATDAVLSESRSRERKS